RDRRGGRKPKIPSFESKTYEPREDRPFAPISNIELLPGETLARYASRPEPVRPEPQTASPVDETEGIQEVTQQLEDVGVDASAVEGTVPDLSHHTDRDEITPTPSLESVQPPEAPAAKNVEERVADSANPESDGEPKQGSARMTDRTDNMSFAHRSSNRRQ